MKTIALFLFVAIISGQTFAQKTYVDYIDIDRGNSTPKEVRKLAEIASNWDVSQSPDFDSRNKPYTVIFKSNKGLIEITYDNKGKVTQSNEIFRSVSMPLQLAQYVLKRYPEHKIIDTKYKFSSENGKGSMSSYNIVLQNGDIKKKLEITNDIN